MSGYVKTFQVKDGDKDKNNNFISFCIDDKKSLEKYKGILTKSLQRDSNPQPLNS